MSKEMLLTEFCSGLLCITSTTGLTMCVLMAMLLISCQRKENLIQLRVIAIDSPTMDSPTSIASTCTSSSAPITSTSPYDAILTCNSGIVDEPYYS